MIITLSIIAYLFIGFLMLCRLVFELRRERLQTLIRTGKPPEMGNEEATLYVFFCGLCWPVLLIVGFFMLYLLPFISKLPNAILNGIDSLIGFISSTRKKKNET